MVSAEDGQSTIPMAIPNGEAVLLKQAFNDLYKTTSEEMQSPLALGQTWHLVSKRWFDLFVDAARSVKPTSKFAGNSIDNSDLCNVTKDDYVLRPQLQEDKDFVLIPESSVARLIETFAYDSRRMPRLIHRVIRFGPVICPLPRKTVKTQSGTLVIEIYPRHLRVHTRQEPATLAKSFEISAHASFFQLRRAVLRLYHQPDDRPAWFWSASPNETSSDYSPLALADDACIEAFVDDGGTLQVSFIEPEPAVPGSQGDLIMNSNAMSVGTAEWKSESSGEDAGSDEVRRSSFDVDL